jgi:large subunit ribosomal protein L10
MALRLDDKKAMVAEVAGVAQTALSVVAAEYRGLKVSQMTSLRSKAQFECIGKSLKGPLVLAFSKEDPGAAARLIKTFAKDNDKLVPTVVSLGGVALTAKDLDKVASLPTLDTARSMLLGVLQAPASKLVRTIAEPHAKLVRALAAVKDKMEASA